MRPAIVRLWQAFFLCTAFVRGWFGRKNGKTYTLVRFTGGVTRLKYKYEIVSLYIVSGIDDKTSFVKSIRCKDRRLRNYFYDPGYLAVGTVVF